jgi:hypothetical protein
MTEYTVAEVRAMIADLQPMEVECPDAEPLASAAAALEGVEELLLGLPAEERLEAVASPSALTPGEDLWVPVAHNCARSVGVAVEKDGLLSFVVKGEGDALTHHFAARSAAARALSGRTPRTKGSPLAEKAPAVERPSGEDGEDPLVTEIKARGWAVPVGRALDDLDGELLARVHALSREGVAHLFAEDGGIVLAMAGSTAGDRWRAVERLPETPERPLASRKVFGVLLDAHAGEHYSEKESWGLSRHDSATPEGLLDAAAERFKAARYYRPALPGAGLDPKAVRRRANPAPRALLATVLRADSDKALALLVLARLSIAVLRERLLRAGPPWDSEAERRRMSTAGERVRREMFTRRESGEDLVVKPARKLDAEREASRDTH